MKLSIVTPKGLFYEGMVDSIVVEGDNGQLGILENHVPIVVPIKNGFVKRTTNNIDTYNAISGGLLEFSNNVATIIAQETVEGTTLEQAYKNLEENRRKIKESNRRMTMDFSEMEKELALNLKEIQASKIKQ